MVIRWRYYYARRIWHKEKAVAGIVIVPYDLTIISEPKPEPLTNTKKDALGAKIRQKLAKKLGRILSRRKGWRHTAPPRFTSDGRSNRINEFSGDFTRFCEVTLWVIPWGKKRYFLKIAPQVTLWHQIFEMFPKSTPTLWKTLCRSTRKGTREKVSWKSEKRGDAKMSIASRFLCAVRSNIDIKNKSEPRDVHEVVRIRLPLVSQSEAKLNF